MGPGHTKPVGDVARPLAQSMHPGMVLDSTRAPSTSRDALPMPPTVTPSSSARIPALSPGEPTASETALFPTIQSAARSAGQPLNRDVSARLGAQLNTDLGDVRVHTDEKAAQAADAAQAKAFTVGRDIVFGSGQYQPNSSSGQHLLAHELVHVAQPSGNSSQLVSSQGDASEREADHAANRIMQGESFTAQTATSAAVQREPLPGADKGSNLSVTDRLLDSASPFLAASVGSNELSNFDTGKSDLKPVHLTELRKTANHITQLLKQYPQSSVNVIGHTDTVGTEENNLQLGQARAVATADMLGKLGVPASIISTMSAGEASPQAVKTKNETPSAKNRRVEVRFQPKADAMPSIVPALEPKTKEKDPDSSITTTPPPLDLGKYKPGVDLGYKGPPYRHDDTNPAWFKPVPPAPKGSGPKSLIDVIGEKVIDPVVDRVAHGLSKDVRDKIKSAARDGVKSGAAKLARMAAEGAGVKDPQALDAIEKATEAAIQEKGSQSP